MQTLYFNYIQIISSFSLTNIKFIYRIQLNQMKSFQIESNSIPLIYFLSIYMYLFSVILYIKLKINPL